MVLEGATPSVLDTILELRDLAPLVTGCLRARAEPASPGMSPKP